jgi:hypothetical protein
MGFPARVIEHGAVQVSLWTNGGNTIAFEGVVREADVDSWLLPLIDDVHRTATIRQFAELVLDIRKLEYANATLWKCLVLWLKRLREEQAGRYVLRIVADTTRPWQHIGIPKLRVFGGNRLLIEECTP